MMNNLYETLYTMYFLSPIFFLLLLKKDQGPYSPTILQNILSLVLKIFLYLEAFECNTTSDWLNRTV